MTGILKRANHGILAALVVWAAIAVGGASCAGTNTPAGPGLAPETLRVQLAEGTASVDVYWPEANGQAPLVIIAHGFSRNRRNMSGWGRHLSQEGFVAVVPDLPARSDHARNGRFISDLKEYFCAGESWKKRIDPARAGLMGFSAGGLSTLLAAADSPVWRYGSALIRSTGTAWGRRPPAGFSAELSS